MDLFNSHPVSKRKISKYTPLAERCRPKKLTEIIGHQDIIGTNSVLWEEVRNNEVKSLILWGPPGVGKTSLAEVISNEVNADFIAISAVTSGVGEVRKVIEKATKNRGFLEKQTILFIDEIHRFNKAQQDALLHSVEDGTLILIGATTENPSFEVIPPLLSRCQVYQMRPLTNEQIHRIIERAIKTDDILKNLVIQNIDWDILEKLAGGDARRGLNILEKSIAILRSQKKPLHLSKQIFEKVVQQKVLYYDKAGEYHYDLISAFIKSVRGSDPDAAVYWMARMLEGGEDPKFIARRMIILASEDIGNADPYALTLATNGFTAVTYIGMPESRIILSQVATYLASAPKSNAAYLAIEKAMEDVLNSAELPVPLHLRNAPTDLMTKLDYGKDYKYAHNYPGHFVMEKYLPDDLHSRIYYSPTTSGKENEISKRLTEMWKNFKHYPDHNEKKEE
jgi:putative ATPase